MTQQPIQKKRLLTAALTGMGCFLLFALPGLVLIYSLDQPFLAGLVTGAGGSLLLSLLTEHPSSHARMILAGTAGMLAGMIGPFLVVMAAALLIPSSQTPAPPRWGDVLVMVSNGVFFGGLFGWLAFGKKTLLSYMILSGLAALPFGLLTSLVNANPFWKLYLSSIHPVFGQLDLSFLFGSAALGTGAGLCTAVYGRNVFKVDRPNSE